ncbi:GNAT family N-acetyltransferase [Streptomyces sp. MS06]|uniref:GNAT family N-acetyltransferase n=1 Tax=Streptomyces sp. MS06 TaxID=3385974 RepID=UPI0039A185C8
MSSSTDYVIRPVRAEEWAEVKQLRLASLRDPLAHLAFLDTYEKAAARPDSYWQQRAAGAGERSPDARQFVAVAADGAWIGTATVLVEEAGTTDWAGFPVEQRQGHVVGVFVHPHHRGTGLTGALFDAAVTWSWRIGLERVRLIVHQDNARALAFYRKAGFEPSGVTVPLPGSGESELEFVLAPARRPAEPG